MNGIVAQKENEVHHAADSQAPSNRSDRTSRFVTHIQNRHDGDEKTELSEDGSHGSVRINVDR